MPTRKPERCVVCNSGYVAAYGAFANRFSTAIDLYFCMECESFYSPFSKPNPIASSVAWHQSVEERNLKAAGGLLDNLAEHGIRPTHILDIGAGTGTLLRKARERGISGVGFDLDKDSIEFGRMTYGLDLRAEEWTPDADAGNVDLILCIMVLEHIHYPRGLMNALMKGAKRYKCPLFVSVPFFDRYWWPHLLTDNSDPKHPLNQPHVHVSHFSRQGMIMAFSQLGASEVKPLQPPLWSGMLIYP